MKSKLIAVSLLTVAFLVFAGCATAPAGSTPAQIAAVDAANAQKIQDASIVLRSAARSAATLAIQADPNNAKYVTLSVTALNEFFVTADHTPGALKAALQPVIKQVSDPKIGLAVDTISDLYEAFYGHYVKDKIKDNATASLFLTALRDGAQDALNISKVSAAVIQPQSFDELHAIADAVRSDSIIVAR